MTYNLCSKFKRLARWTMDTLSEAKLQGADYSEEAVTHGLFLKLAKYRGPQFLFRMFPKSDEKRTGSDYEIWFSQGKFGDGISIRVQAKRLYEKAPNINRYGALKGSSSTQHATLLKESHNIRAVPLYVFYNHFGFLCSPQVPTAIRYGPFSLWGLWGCSIAPVTAIPNRRYPHPHEINPMEPWHVLVCPDGRGQRPPLPRIAADKLENLYRRAKKDHPFSFELEGPPKWVEHLHDKQDYGEGLDNYLKENNLAAVIHMAQPTD